MRIRFLSKLLFVSSFIITGVTLGFTACGSNTPSNPTPIPMLSSEQVYETSVNAFLNRLNDHRKEYNTGLEQIGTRVKSATTETELRQAFQQAITHLDNIRQLLRQDMSDFTNIIPPPEFQDFYLLLNSAMKDNIDALTGFITYYSLNLNMGTQDLELANHASDLLRTANDEFARAGFMYDNLIK